MMTGCSSGKALIPVQLRQRLQAEQRQGSLLIGWKNQDHLEYLDINSPGTFKSVSLGATDHEAVSDTLELKTDHQQSQHGKWLASCAAGGQCVISEKEKPLNRFSVSQRGLLTPVYFSADGNFALFVKMAPKWRLPVRCSLEDEWDVTVRDISAGTEGIVGTVCGGFPYGALRWYSLAK
jgi:hypothetical protein